MYILAFCKNKIKSTRMCNANKQTTVNAASNILRRGIDELASANAAGVDAISVHV